MTVAEGKASTVQLYELLAFDWVRSFLTGCVQSCLDGCAVQGIH